MTWVTWRQYRYQGALATALLAALAVLLLITGLHAASVWHSALTRCLKVSSCGSLAGSNLSLANPTVAAFVVATSVVPLLPGLLWGAPMVAQELETGTNQFAWTQSTTRRRWLAVRTGWLLLVAAVLAAAVSAVVTWWSGPNNALNADAFMVNRFDITDLVPVAYTIFAMALGICAGTLLRRTLPALAVTVAGFVGLRALIALWLRLHYMTPVTAYYKLTTQIRADGVLLEHRSGHNRPGRQALRASRPLRDRVRRAAGPARLPERHGRPRQRDVLHDVPRLPGVCDLSASQPVLGFPGHRDRRLPCTRGCPARHHVLGARAAGRIAETSQGRRSRAPTWMICSLELATRNAGDTLVIDVMKKRCVASA